MLPIMDVPVVLADVNIESDLFTMLNPPPCVSDK